MSPRQILTLLRPEHWVKNLFIFIPAFFAARLNDPAVMRNAVLGFVAFCLIASAVYVLNDMVDAPQDRNHPDKNVISRALGSHKEVEVSTWSQPFSVQLDDTFLLCSDGLYDLVDDEQIRLTIGGPAQHVQIACDRLVALARQNGGHDNISVAILRMRAAGDEPAAVMETRAIEVIP